MKRTICLLFVFFLLISPSLAKDKKGEFDAQAALGHIKEMSSDSMQGRQSGQPGGVMCEDYIASKLKEWGLEPAGDNGTYFQNFTFEYRQVAEGVAMEIITKRGRRDFYYGEDWRIQRYSGSGHLTSEIVFVGYGIHAPDKKYDDYSGIDVKGEIVLLSSDSSQTLSKKFGDAADINKRIEAAQKLGARGVITFRVSTATQGGRYSRLRMDKKLYQPDFVMLSIERKVVDYIFKDLPTETRALFQEIESRSAPQSFQTGVKAYISVNSLVDEKRPTRNVLAKITGNDKKLKDEYIIIGAHMDHLGITPMGDVMNGANDNASGTATVMEIARIMKLRDKKPKKTVIFAAFAAEEEGLLGSRYYADHPEYPLERTISNINLDMVGHGSGKVPLNGVYYGPQIWNILKEKLPKEILDSVSPGRGGPGGSDHTPFLEKGIPAFFIITRGAIKYHHSRDDNDLIRPEMLKKVGDLVDAAVDILASEPGNFIQPMRQETYQLKYQTIINHKLSPLTSLMEKHGDTKDSPVKLQLSVIEEKEGLSGDELRVALINDLFSASDEMKKAKGLSFYSSSERLRSDIRGGKTTVMPGLIGLNSLRGNPKWAEVLAEQGIYFILVDDPSFLFGEKGLNEEGKKIIEAANSSGLLLIIKGTNDSQAEILLNGSKKPLILLENNLPGKNVLELIKENNSAVGLILGAKTVPSAYFKILNEAKKAIGTQHLMIVNEQCLWGDAGRVQMLEVISEMIKGNFESADMSNVFSAAFFRVLNEVRKEEAQQVIPYMPF